MLIARIILEFVSGDCYADTSGVSAVSQMEHGVMHLVNEADPRITVLMDCQGLSPIRFPMQMMKSCATILQDHYPNRLAILYILRLPPVSRVITQTFMKVSPKENCQFLV